MLRTVQHKSNFRVQIRFDVVGVYRLWPSVHSNQDKNGTPLGEIPVYCSQTCVYAFKIGQELCYRVTQNSQIRTSSEINSNSDPFRKRWGPSFRESWVNKGCSIDRHCLTRPHAHERLAAGYTHTLRDFPTFFFFSRSSCCLTALINALSYKPFILVCLFRFASSTLKCRLPWTKRLDDSCKLFVLGTLFGLLAFACVCNLQNILAKQKFECSVNNSTFFQVFQGVKMTLLVGRCFNGMFVLEFMRIV